MFNVITKKIAGIHFMRFGRISLTVCVQTPAQYEVWLERKANQLAHEALMKEFGYYGR